MDTPSNERLKPLIVEAVTEALKQQPLPLFTAPQVASILCVSTPTILTWRKAGMLKGRAHVLSGRSWRWLFDHAEILRFVDSYFPTQDDIAAHFGLAPSTNPKTNKIVQMKKMLALRRLYARTHNRRKKN